MDPAPDVLRTQIASTRASLDRHLDELGTRIDVTKERVKTSAQLWGGIGAVAAGLVGMVMFWPRKIERRRVAHPFRRASAS
jgi:hypothetical protein